MNLNKVSTSKIFESFKTECMLMNINYTQLSVQLINIGKKYLQNIENISNVHNCLFSELILEKNIFKILNTFQMFIMKLNKVSTSKMF